MVGRRNRDGASPWLPVHDWRGRDSAADGGWCREHVEAVLVEEEKGSRGVGGGDGAAVLLENGWSGGSSGGHGAAVLLDKGWSGGGGAAVLRSEQATLSTAAATRRIRRKSAIDATS